MMRLPLGILTGVGFIVGVATAATQPAIASPRA
jgi:hypothetical protein